MRMVAQQPNHLAGSALAFAVNVLLLPILLPLFIFGAVCGILFFKSRLEITAEDAGAFAGRAKDFADR